MIAPDTSVLIAGFATWHDGHESAVRALNRGVHLIAHTALETYSVLTRLPPPHRVEPVAVHGYLADVTSSEYLTLDARSHRDLIDLLAEHGVTGGATYDALVGLTAKAAGATLLTRDVRAVTTYERLRLEFELVT
ncbi:type II toxin-antitoxin system VapC family toxin [Mycobacterium riyadhense]|uniref:Ribonuclease VapC n=1 Tax=Mycobacterium riyadhense TaxID=486698 RepID=A0A1X2DHU9_9MYCO|nr:type II toxin-antitoxin system VapC family toxin [Mycobacterium riyadhense]MCV7144703.1 type II toxin-antitoxin system VapC family toxin [Mycobacterium riyadhense]ORW87279.1 ribonuclease [Mycobacterium riyadhense]VTO96771.1 Ribonuclease VapC40 [Mycobacterium riyadhense]